MQENRFTGFASSPVINVSKTLTSKKNHQIHNDVHTSLRAVLWGRRGFDSAYECHFKIMLLCKRVFNLHQLIWLNRSDVVLTANLITFLFQWWLTTHQRFNHASQTISALKLFSSCCFSAVVIRMKHYFFFFLWVLLTPCCLLKPV